VTSFENEIVIRRPPEDVFVLLADLEKVPRWNPAIERTERTTPGDVGVGSTYRQLRSAPTRSEETFRIVRFDPPERLALDGQIGSFGAHVDYVLERTPGGTRLTNRVSLEPPTVLSRVVVPLAVSQISAAVASNLDRLRRIMEEEV